MRKQLRPWLLMGISLALFQFWPGLFFQPDLRANQEQAALLAGLLDQQHSLTQTISPGTDGLCAIDIFAKVPPGRFSHPYRVYLTLASGDQKIAEYSILLTDLQAQPRIRLKFKAQPASKGRVYSLRTSTDAPPNTVSLLASREDAYANGQLYQNETALNRDLAFRAYTAVTPASLIIALFSSWQALMLSLVLTVLAGLLGWVVWECFELPLPLEEALPWLLGSGVCLTILLFTLLGSQWAWGLLAVALVPVIRTGRRWLHRSPRPIPYPIARPNLIPALPLLALFIGSLMIRLEQVEPLSAPLWIDGYRNLEMLTRILAAGRLPTDLLYHTGFHSLAAVVQPLGERASLSPPILPHMVLIIGQWAGAIGAITLYPLARRLLGGSSNGALWATLFYSCLSTFPQYLFNWGRYPFILGLALLPLLLAALIDLTRRLALSDRGWINYGGLTMLLGAGMVLAHYSTAFFTLSFGLLWLIIERRAIPWKNLRTQLIPVGLGLLTFILALVLLILVRFGPEVLASLSSKWMATLAQSREASNELDYAEIIRLQLRGWGLWLWLAAGTGALFAAFYRRRLLVLTAGWFTTQAALTALQAPILGYGLASYGNLLLAAGLPAALLAGGLAVRLSEWLKAAPRRARLLSRIRGLAPAGMACLALAGGLAAVGLLNPATVLLAPQDIPALTWLQENTLTDAVILVNSSRWGTSSVVPSDSGAWVPFSTSRSIVYLTERLTGDELASFIKQQDVDYVYLGRGGGFLVMSDFTSGAFEPVYDQAGVRIFRVNSH